MQYYLLQIALILFAVFAITRALLRFKDHEITISEFIFWEIIWIGVIVVSIVPGILSGVAESLGIESGINLIVYVSIIILFYLVFRVYVRLENQDKKMTTIIREISIKKSKKK